jgi:hypothetical protein
VIEGLADILEGFAELLGLAFEWRSPRRRSASLKYVVSSEWSSMTNSRTAQIRVTYLPPDPDAGRGSMTPEMIDPILESLKPATTTPDRCFFALWEGYGGSVAPPHLEPKLDLPNRRYHVFTGPIEAARTPIRELGQSANLWWPSDHAWCVASEIDLMWTYIGGSRHCIDTILADSRLESVETTAMNRS